MTTSFNEFDTVWAPPNKAVDGNGAIHDTVQSAIDQDTGVVLIGPGTFSENANVPRNSDQAGGIIMGVGQGSKIDGGSGHALHIHADDVTVQNIAVETTAGGGNTANALFVDDTQTVSDPRIENVTVVDSDSDGIRVANAAGGWITDCNVEAVDDDGIFSGAERMRIEGNYVGETDSVDIGGDGIVADANRQKVHDNYVHEVSDDGIEARASDQSIMGNTIDGAGSDGVELQGTDQRVSDNIYLGITAAEINTTNATTPKINRQGVIDSGSVTLSSGAATVDTGISESETATFEVAIGPDTDSAEIEYTVEANSGGNYEIHIDEVNTAVGNPTVRYDIVRVR